MFMTTEKIPSENLPIPDRGLEEHPAVRAVRMVKELHQENIKLIDGGYKFVKTHDDGTVEDVSNKIRAASMAQLAMCDEIIKRAPNMSREHSEAAEGLLSNIEKETTRLKSEIAAIDKVKPSDTEIPEVGNYDHKED